MYVLDISNWKWQAKKIEDKSVFHRFGHSCSNLDGKGFLIFGGSKNFNI